MLDSNVVVAPGADVRRASSEDPPSRCFQHSCGLESDIANRGLQPRWSAGICCATFYRAECFWLTIGKRVSNTRKISGGAQRGPDSRFSQLWGNEEKSSGRPQPLRTDLETLLTGNGFMNIAIDPAPGF